MVDTLFPLPAWCQTYISGKVITADGMAVASGAVALEKGELHNNAFLVGGSIGSDGTFKIPLPAGGPWGLHVYSEKYIYSIIENLVLWAVLYPHLTPGG